MGDIAPVAAHLAALGLRHQQLDDETVMLGFSAEQTDYEVWLTRVGPLVALVATNAAVVPAARLDEAVRLANRINTTRLYWGGFCVHPESRRLTFELALPAPGGPSREQVALALGAVCLNRYWPAFARVLWGGCDAAAALAADDAAEDDEGDDGAEITV